jgi:uncharacterized protein with ParB-like and HNH nuclease domain
MVVSYQLPFQIKEGKPLWQGAKISQAALEIDRLVNRIRGGDIKIPAFQRGFVWNQEQIIELLGSIY